MEQNENKLPIKVESNTGEIKLRETLIASNYPPQFNLSIIVRDRNNEISDKAFMILLNEEITTMEENGFDAHRRVKRVSRAIYFIVRTVKLTSLDNSHHL